MKRLLLSVVAVLALTVCLAPPALAQPDPDQSKIVAAYTDVPKAGGGIIAVDAAGKAVAETFPYKSVDPVVGVPIAGAAGKMPAYVRLVYSGGSAVKISKVKAKASIEGRLPIPIPPSY